jgi:hypothetical protein
LFARDQVRIDMRKQLSMFHFILLIWWRIGFVRYEATGGRKLR